MVRLKRTLIVLLMAIFMVSLSAFCFTLSAKAEQQLTFKIDYAKMEYFEDKTNGIDAGKTGIEFKSTVSGDSAENSVIKFDNVFTGNFEIDFRILSQLAYQSKINDVGGDYYSHYPKGLPYDTSNLLSDDFNPYTDVKKVSFKFTSIKDASKSFKVSVRSGFSGYAESLDFRTEILGETFSIYGITGYGLNRSGAFNPDQKGYEGTLVYNSTFSNYNGYAGGAGNPTVVGFDFENMQTYTYDKDTKYVVRNLSNNDSVVENYRTLYSTLLKSDFADGYTVDIIFDDVTSNSTVGTDSDANFGNINRAYEVIDSPYERYIDMFIYSVNGIDMTGDNYDFVEKESFDLLLDSSKFDFVENSNNSLDLGKKGLKIKSVISGDAVDGNAVKLTNVFTGNFEIDFRVLSKLAYQSKIDDVGGDYYSHYPKGLPYDTSNLLSDEFNPYVDLKKVSFKFTSIKDASKSFKVSVRSGFSGYVEGLDFRTEINGEIFSVYGITGYGLNRSGAFDPDQKGYEGTLIYNSTFSNYNGYVGGAGNSTVVGFDLTSMQTYTKNGSDKVLIRTLSNNDGVVDGYKDKYLLLNNSDFADGYTVEIVFDDVTSNSTVGTDDSSKYGNIDRAYELINSPYDRYAEMCIYSINDCSLISENNCYEITSTKSDRKLDSFISYDDEEIRVTKNQTAIVSKRGENNTFNLDSGRKGLLVSSVKSGNDAEGSGFSFNDTMSGTFTIDFRAYSKKTYNGTMGTGEFYVDSLNPYLDVKQIEFKFNSTTGKSFSVFVDGAIPWKNNTTMISVKTEGMSTAEGLSYDEGGYYNEPVLSGSDYKMAAHGTSFSNASWAAYDVWLENGGICNYLEFDSKTMQVYTNALDSSGKVCKVLVLDLKNPDHVGKENVLSSADFKKFNVSVIFNDVTDNATEVDGETYERFVNMLIYSVNGVNFEDSNGYVSKTVDSKPYLYLISDSVEINKSANLTPQIYDGIDGQSKYNGKVYYAINNGNREELVENSDGDYLFTPTGYDKITVYVDEYQPSTGNKVENVALELSIFDKISPVLEIKNDIKNTFDLLNDANRSVSGDDVLATTNHSSKSVQVKVQSIKLPSGNVVTDNFDVFNKLGKYTVTYYAVDNFGNESTIDREITVLVADYKGITLSLKSELLNKYDIGSSPRPQISVEDVVVDSDERFNTSVKVLYVETPDGKIFANYLNAFSKVGTYKVYYLVEDEIGGQATIIREIEAGHFNGPTISVKETTINASVGQSVNLAPLSVVATDGTTVSYTVKVYLGEQLVSSDTSFIPTTAGEYSIIYSATDQYGNASELEIKLVVSEIETESKIGVGAWIGIISGAVVIVAGITVFVLLRKKRTKNAK